MSNRLVTTPQYMWHPLPTIFTCGTVRRETDGKREHRLRVYSELIFGHEANKPAEGTKNYNRTCMPYPFMGEMTVDEAASDFRIAIDGFRKTASPQVFPHLLAYLYQCVCSSSAGSSRVTCPPQFAEKKC